MPRTGRPKGSGLTYTPELGQLICDRVAKGESLEAICKDADMPPPTTVRGWEQSVPQFAVDYARAREQRVEVWADQIVQISDDGTNDTYRNDDGSLKIAHDHIQRSRLRVDTRKWLMSKMAPRNYGEFQRTELSGPNGDPVQVNVNVRLRKLPDADD